MAISFQIIWPSRQHLTMLLPSSKEVTNLYIGWDQARLQYVITTEFNTQNIPKGVVGVTLKTPPQYIYVYHSPNPEHISVAAVNRWTCLKLKRATVLRWHCALQCYSDTARNSVTVTLRATVLQWHYTLQWRCTLQWHCALQCYGDTATYSVAVTLHKSKLMNK